MPSNAEIEALLSPTIEGLGYELVGIEYIPSGKHSVLRIFIDKPEGIDVDDCATVSRQVSGVLDVEDPIRNEYSLEVSSPGLDRPLFKQEHYQRFAGQKCQVRLKRMLDGRRKVSGVIESAEGDSVTLRLDDESSVELPLVEIDKANLVPEF